MNIPPLPQSPSLRVLVVDDDEMTYLVYEAMLEGTVAEVTWAHSGEAAIHYLAEHPVDLVLMDCHMEGKDGLETTKEIRAVQPSLPLVAITSDPSYRTAMIGAGCRAFLVKPVTMELLSKAVDVALGRSA